MCNIFWLFLFYIMKNRVPFLLILKDSALVYAETCLSIFARQRILTVQGSSPLCSSSPFELQSKSSFAGTPLNILLSLNKKDVY